MMKTPLYKKALWIAEELGYGVDPEDVYDVLLGTIKKPEEFVASVESRLHEYDTLIEKNS